MEWTKQNKGFLALTLFSLLWISGAVCLLALEIKKEDFYSRDMPLNELGDYLAGAFSPLAFAWLIYGYFMQNRELEMNREELLISRLALEKQAEELYNSVQEQKELVNLTKIEIENLINSQLPILHIDASYYYPKGSAIPMILNNRYAKENEVIIYISNHGRDAKNSYMEIVSEGETITSEVKQLDKSCALEFCLVSDKIPKPPFIVKFHFTIESLDEYFQEIHFYDELSQEYEIKSERLNKPLKRLNNGY